MANAKFRKEKQKKDYENTLFAMNMGIVAAVIAVISVIKDILSYMKFGNDRVIGLASGFIVAVVTGVILKMDLSKMFTNKKNVRNLIDFFTTNSVIIYIIENLLLNSVAHEDKIIGLIMLIAIIIGCIGISWWTFFVKPDRKHNMD